MSAMWANDSYLHKIGSSARDRVIHYAQRDFEQKVRDNPGFEVHATRNGIPQRFLITRSDVTYKSNVIAFPGEELYPGDVLEFGGEHWIMQQTRVTNAIQVSGIAWLCNHLFRFQTFSSTIHERWGVLDSGVYSTSRTSDSTVMSLDMQYKIYLPGDDITKLIHEDQRIATDKWVDKNGDPILLVYGITGRDLVSKSYGEGAHLLILNARSSSYNPDRDNYELMICDYIAEDTTTHGDGKPMHIVGRNYMRIGSSRVYDVSGTVGNVEVPINKPSIEWSTDADYVTIKVNAPTVSITVPDDKRLIGSVITLTAKDSSGEYADASLRIEVVS